MKQLIFLLSVFFLAGCTNINVQEEPISPSAIAGDDMRVSFIDVGQGDSILIEAPNGKTMLIDAGVKGKGQTVVEYIRQQGIKRLDYVVATHPDADHIGGLVPVLNSVAVRQFMDSGKVHTSQTYENMLKLIDTKNIPFTAPKAGDTIALDEAVLVEVLYADAAATDNNEASIVLKVTYGDVSFMLMGDAGIEIEQQLVEQIDVSATVLKAGHHGSNTSSSPTFVEAVNPEVTILSYGQDNKYGHPHYEVTSAVKQIGGKLYGTAETGTIVVTTNGVGYDIKGAEWTGIGATSSIVKPTSGKVDIVSKDLHAELVTIKNFSEKDVSLKDWTLVSVEGSQTFTFPNITLKAGKSITVSSGPNAVQNATTLEWTKRQIWLNDGDAAQLLNAKGVLVSEVE